MSPSSENPVESLVAAALERVSQTSGGSLPKGPLKPTYAQVFGSYSGIAENPGNAEHLISGGELGVFSTTEQAVRVAKTAQRELMQIPVEKRKQLVAVIRDAVHKAAEVLSALAVKETGLGRFEDKVFKHHFVADKTPGMEDLPSMVYTGDNGLTLIERAPWGIIAAITPITNPSTTIICNAIGMIAAGNGVVFNPHPGAREVSLAAIRLLNKAIMAVGGPPNLLTSISEPTISSSQALMAHSDINMIVVTGGMGVAKEAMKHGKKVIAAGPGNPPVVVDETANIKKAAENIFAGASFDNNMPCVCEKEIFAVESIADELKYHLKELGTHELSKWQAKRLEKVLLKENRGPGEAGVANPAFIGKDARAILDGIGIRVKDDIKLVLIETGFEHPFVWTELIMPVIPLVRTNDVDQAIEMALKAERGQRHTAMIHSKNIENMTKMAKAAATTLFVKNGPGYDALGVGGEGFCSMTIASFTGEGMTSARDFTRERRCVMVDYLGIV